MVMFMIFQFVGYFFSFLRKDGDIVGIGKNFFLDIEVIKIFDYKFFKGFNKKVGKEEVIY